MDKRLYGTKDLQFVVVNATAEFKTRSDLWLSGYNKYGYNADTERIATSIVTWNICDGWFNNSSESTAVGIFTEDMSSSMATNVKACYNKIKEQMLSHLTIPSYAVKPTVTNVPKQKMTTNSDGTFTITLTDSKNVSKYYDWQTAIKNTAIFR